MNIVAFVHKDFPDRFVSCEFHHRVRCGYDTEVPTYVFLVVGFVSWLEVVFVNLAPSFAFRVVGFVVQLVAGFDTQDPMCVSHFVGFFSVA